MKKLLFCLRVFAAFFIAQVALAALVYFVPPVRDGIIEALQQERATWEPSERIVWAEYFVQTTPEGLGYMASGKVYVYECAAQAAQIDVNGTPDWIQRSDLKTDVCLAGQP
jgi:hypothetical protein